MLKWEMMRENMICKEKSELLICLGGKIKDDKSQQGVDIEVELAKSVNVPVALVGTVGGRIGALTLHFRGMSRELLVI